jgi:hypothetical protein
MGEEATLPSDTALSTFTRSLTVDLPGATSTASGIGTKVIGVKVGTWGYSGSTYVGGSRSS